MPEISIILKVDDGNRYLQEAVNNVFMQSFSDFELLVLKEGANYEDTLDGMDTIDMRLRILNVVSFEEPGKHKGEICCFNGCWSFNGSQETSYPIFFYGGP